MFSHQSDASKIALSGLVAFCRAKGIAMIDCQQNTRHLASLGAAEIPRADFIKQVQQHAQMPSPIWIFDTLDWQQILKPQP
jgi:leucyl/phenylalanyl-tRNA--protein transferase